MPVIEGAASRGPVDAASGRISQTTIQWLVNSTAPSGTTGQGFAAKGSLCTAADTGKLYVNNGTAATPSWGIVTSA